MIILKLYSIVSTYLACCPVILLNFASSLTESDPLPDSTGLGPRETTKIDTITAVKKRKESDWFIY